MSSTATRIIKIPTPNRSVKASPKTVTPTTTAVRGSSAPMMAVGVEPMAWTACVMVTSEMTVGTKASMMEKNHMRGVVSGCSGV